MTEDDRKEKFLEMHLSPFGGHHRIAMTQKKIRDRYYWYNMAEDIADMVSFVMVDSIYGQYNGGN